MGAFVFNDVQIFPKDTLNDSIKFILALMVMYIGQIPAIMSLSTLFKNDKVANFFVNVLNALIALVYIMIVTLEGNQKRWIYLFYLNPTMPALTIVVDLVSNPNIPKEFRVMDVEYLSITASWVVLGLNIIFWLYAYIYLD
jgi:hypothetical protein